MVEKFREENWKKGNKFSYALHRFSLPTFYELGYKKVLMCDCDVDIRYDLIGKDFTEFEFWDQFNTKPNSLKGCDLETFDSRTHIDDPWRFNNITMSNIIKYELGDQNINIFSRECTQTEGPFRFYNFSNFKYLVRLL